MRTRTLIVGAALVLVLCGGDMPVRAQRSAAGGPQIPTLQVCNPTKISGEGLVRISSRADATHPGTFVVRINLACDPAGTGYPTGALAVGSINMVDSAVLGTISATTFEQVTSTGKYSPTVYLNGRCQAPGIIGCHYWLLIADNNSIQGPLPTTPDVVSFLVFNAAGVRIAYGTGPVVKGNFAVTQSGS